MSEHSSGLPEPRIPHGHDDGTARRDFLKGAGAAAAAAAGGIAAGQWAGASPAHAGTQPQLPPIGAEIPCSCLALNVPLTIRAMNVTLDFKGGIKVKVQANPNKPPGQSVYLKVIGHKVSADHPDLGTVTIEQADVEATPASVLTLVGRTPPSYETTMFLDFTLTVENPPAPRIAGATFRRPEPLVLNTKNPAKLRAQLNNFPPEGSIYQLQNPIELVLPDNPDETIASIDKFPVKVGGM